MMADAGQEDALWQKLKGLPTLFQLDLPRMAERHFRKAIRKLRSEKDQVPEEFNEDVRSENLLAFFLLYIDKIEEAKPHIDSVLMKCQDSPNLVALGNICAYHLKQYNVSQAKNYLEEFDTVMKGNDQNVEDKRTVAIGEQAYCLSRLGPKCHLMAADKFREALGRGPPNYQLKIKWNYGLALCLDRYLDRQNFAEDPDFEPTELYEEAQRCLKLVTESNVQALCGKGWVALGEVHSKFLKIPHKYFKGTGKPRDLNSLHDQIDECFESGLVATPNDHFVLERIGRHYRHRRRISDAIECLKKANKVRPSAFSWHHLGLAYRSKAPRGRSSTRGSFPGRGYGCSGDSRPRGARGGPCGGLAAERPQRYQRSAPLREGRGGQGHPDWQSKGGGGQGHPGEQWGGRGRFGGSYQSHDSGFYDVGQENEGRSCPLSFQQRQWHPSGDNSGGGGRQQGCANQSPGVGSPRQHFSTTDEYQDERQHNDDVDQVQRGIDRMTLSSPDQFKSKGAQPNCPDFLEKAKQCFEEAYDLCEGTGMFIPVSLAEVYMQKGENEKALEWFRKAIDKDNFSTSLEAATCYQRWGECFLQMGQKENGKNMLRKAVESAAKVNIEKKGAFATLVTLMQRDLRPGDQKSDHLNELARLHELVKRDREALDLRKTALQLSANDPTTLRGLVDNLRAQGDYVQAKMYLSMLRALTDVEVPMETVIEVNLGAAELEARQDPNLARDIFRETFDFVFPTELHLNVMYDVFVYSDEEDRQTAEQVTTLCEGQLDLSCRYVHRDIPCTVSVLETVADLANKSTCVILVVSKTSLQKGKTEYTIGLIVDMLINRGFGNIVTVTVDHCDLPHTLSVYPSITMGDCLAQTGGLNTNLFTKMISTDKSTVQFK